MGRSKLTTEEWVKKATAKHGNKYDYSKVDYYKSYLKVNIVCPTHGEFEQLASSHLNGQGCPQCGKKLKLTREEFIKKAIRVHGDLYNYEKVDYKGSLDKITITCRVHGDFKQVAATHLSRKGCPECGKSHKLTTGEFIWKATQVHRNVYDYSRVDYVGSQGKVIIICQEHGEFYQRAAQHLFGHGCPKCRYKRKAP